MTPLFQVQASGCPFMAHSRIGRSRSRASEMAPQNAERHAGLPAWIEISPTQIGRDSISLDPWPIAEKLGDISVIISVGTHPSHAYWLQGNSYALIGRRIATPDGYDELLAEADRDAAEVRDAS